MCRLCTRFRWAALTSDRANSSGMGSSGRAELVTRKLGFAPESALASEMRLGMYRWATMYSAETVIWS
jgi:hypothetical protein